MAVTYKKIASVTVGSGGAANIEFTAIAADYDDLLLSVSLRDASTGGDGIDSFFLQFNGDTGSNYSWRRLRGNGSNAASASGTSETRMNVGYLDNNSATASTFSNGQIYIPNYAGSANKSVSSDTVAEQNATAGYQALIAGLWSSGSAITSIKLLPNTAVNFLQYSTATLYGISNS